MTLTVAMLAVVLSVAGEYDGALFALGKIGAECRARKGEAS